MESDDINLTYKKQKDDKDEERGSLDEEMIFIFTMEQ
jgi:hypothetical protein